MSIALASSAALVALLSVPNSAVVLAVLSIVVMGAPLSAYLVPSVSMTSGAAEAAGVALAVSTMLINLAYALGRHSAPRCQPRSRTIQATPYRSRESRSLWH